MFEKFYFSFSVKCNFQNEMMNYRTQDRGFCKVEWPRPVNNVNFYLLLRVGETNNKNGKFSFSLYIISKLFMQLTLQQYFKGRAFFLLVTWYKEKAPTGQNVIRSTETR